MDGNHSESVAFKEFKKQSESTLEEIKISEMMGHHRKQWNKCLSTNLFPLYWKWFKRICYIRIDAFPTFYHFLPETNETKAVIVMERIGKSIKDLWEEFRPFPNITAMQVGLQMVSSVHYSKSFEINRMISVYS